MFAASRKTQFSLKRKTMLCPEGTNTKKSLLLTKETFLMVPRKGFEPLIPA